jgi:hypothetical protein
MSANVRDRRVNFSRLTVLVFLILTLSNVAGSCIGWYYSPDVRVWWPVGLLIVSGLSLGYAVVFSSAVRASRALGYRFAAVYNVVLAVTLLLHAALFYTMKINWLAVNTGLAQLTNFQRLVHSDATVYAIYGTFVIVAWIIVGIMRLRGGG